MKLIIPTGLVGIMALLCSCTLPSQEWSHLTGETMGTSYQVRFQDTTESHYEAIKADTTAVLLSIDSQVSTWSDTSWVSRWNQSEASSQFAAPKHARAIVASSIEVAALSQGAFSPLAFPLIQAWGFGPKQDEATEAPSPERIANLKELCDYQNLRFDPNHRAIDKLKNDVQMDLSASAKGYAVDQIATILEANGITNYLVEIGGELRVSGENQKGHHWRVGIELPKDFATEKPVLELTNVSVATSGGSKVFKTIDHTVRTHVLDLRSGMPLSGAHPTFSVTVIAANCMLADSLATAAFVLGPENSQSLINAYPDTGFIFIQKNGKVINLGRQLLEPKETP